MSDGLPGDGSSIDGGVSALSAGLERAVDAFIAFSDETTYLHHPDVPYHGTEKGDSEEKWRRRVIAAALMPIIADAREACAKECDEAARNTDSGSRCFTKDAYTGMAKMLRSNVK